MKQIVLNRLLDDQAEKRAVALSTDMSSGEQTLVYRDEAEGPDSSNPEVLSIARQAIQDDRSKVHDINGRNIFIEVFNPPLRMVIVGAVHIAQPLSRVTSKSVKRNLPSTPERSLTVTVNSSVLFLSPCFGRHL